MIPARSLVLLALVPVVLAVLTLFDRTLLWPMLATDLGIALVAAADALLVWRPMISVRRQARQVFSVGQPNLVALDLRSAARRKLRLEVRPMDLVAVVEAGIEAVRPAADAKGIRIESRLDSKASAMVGDPDRLQQVVCNLVSNAVKFTPKEGRVDVELTRVDAHARLRVKDTGKGIPSGFLPHVFDRLRQADSTSTRAHGGLGIGLAIVRHLVESHGGTVHALSSGDGQGSTFVVRLPLRVVPEVARSVQGGRPG